MVVYLEIFHSADKNLYKKCKWKVSADENLNYLCIFWLERIQVLDSDNFAKIPPAPENINKAIF